VIRRRPGAGEVVGAAGVAGRRFPQQCAAITTELGMIMAQCAAGDEFDDLVDVAVLVELDFRTA
jgi:hypothetical protein